MSSFPFVRGPRVVLLGAGLLLLAGLGLAQDPAEAIRQGQAWLYEQQDTKSGRWSSKAKGKGAFHRVGTTSLALLALGEVVDADYDKKGKAISYLIGQQDEKSGKIKSYAKSDEREPALALLALSRGASTGVFSARRPAQKAVLGLLGARHRGGGWGAEPSGDSRSTAWALVALNAFGVASGERVLPEADALESWLDARWNPKDSELGEPLEVVSGLYMRHLLGIPVEPADTQRALKGLLSQPPTWNAEGGANLDRWLLQAALFEHSPRELRERWYESSRKVLLAAQLGADQAEAWSWSAVGLKKNSLGPVYASALALAVLNLPSTPNLWLAVRDREAEGAAESVEDDDGRTMAYPFPSPPPLNAGEGKFGGRFSGRGSLRGVGGSGTEETTANGLEWIMRQQNADGGWGAADVQGASLTGATALALLVLHGDGSTPRDGKHSEESARGHARLRALQNRKTGQFLDGDDPCTGLEQTWAVLALAEDLFWSKDPGQQAAVTAGLGVLLDAQQSDGRWLGPGEQRGPNDVLATAWMLECLMAAETGGLPVSQRVWERALGWLESQTDASSGGIGPGLLGTPAGLFARIMGGKTIREDALMKRHGQYILSVLPGADSELEFAHQYFLAYAGLQAGGKLWDSANRFIRSALMKTQIQSGKHRHTWNPDGRLAATRLRATCLGVLTLQVYYRYARSRGGTVGVPSSELAADLSKTAGPFPSKAVLEGPSVLGGPWSTRLSLPFYYSSQKGYSTLIRPGLSVLIAIRDLPSGEQRSLLEMMEAVEGPLPPRARERKTSALGGLLIHSYTVEYRGRLTLYGVALTASGYLMLEARLDNPKQLELAQEILQSIASGKD